MIKGNGIDIIEVNRIENALKKGDRFLQKIFTVKEQKYIHQKNDNTKTIAGMFAAKEAVSKAIGTGIKGFSWHDIEISHKKEGTPIVNLHNNALIMAKELYISQIHLSITHIDKYALAFAICEEEIDEKEHIIKDIRTSIMLPNRDVSSHKGSFGNVAIIGGSIGMTGANYLASTAALRTGSGIVRSVIPKSLNTIMEIKTTEVMTVPIEDYGKGRFVLKSLEYLKNSVKQSDAIGLGPGLNIDIDIKAIVKDILLSIDTPIVLDADGLNCVAEDMDILKDRKGTTIITPHPGEMSRLADVDISAIQKDRLYWTKKISKKYDVIVVLKGNNTIVSYKDKYIVNTTGNPGMATAGSGDVLTGVITSFIGQGIPAFESACFGAYIHGLSGDMAAYDKGEYGIIAGDIINYIPYAIMSVMKN
ncbi:NAD(P)H-hydrate dehydratase [Clostridiisalibacter paucivorans]|uniref:NAD(P)H-hydrate dehydratase n=1 Tax=Clostridiisalibacter paucivorans TaxID=408753 RepID=UPI000478857E|nr:NAD(P)H-hydrate dehydratase [Clostridiisalibacter paucivorans]